MFHIKKIKKGLALLILGAYIFNSAASFAITREDLFKKAFGELPTLEEQTVKGKLAVDGKGVAVIVVKYKPFSREFKFQKDVVFKGLEDFIVEQGIDLLREETGSSEYLTNKQMEANGYKVSFSKRTTILSLETPPEYRKESVQEFREIKDRGKERVDLEPLPFSAYFNVGAEANFQNELVDSLAPFGLILNGAMNLNNFVIKASGYNYIKETPDPITQIPTTEQDFLWNTLEMFYDDFDSGIHYYVGDLNYPSIGFQAYNKLWGIGFKDSFYASNQSASSSTHSQTIYLSETSTVELVMNDEQIGQYFLRAGKHKFSGLPLANGLNKLDVVVWDKNMDEIVSQKRYYVLLDTQILAPGKFKYSMNIGSPVFIEFGKRKMDTSKVRGIINMQTGVSNRLMLGPYYEGGQEQSMMGVEGIYAHEMGKLNFDWGISKEYDRFDTAFSLKLSNYPENSKKIKDEELEDVKKTKLVNWSYNLRFFGPHFYQFNDNVTESALQFYLSMDALIENWMGYKPKVSLSYERRKSANKIENGLGTSFFFDKAINKNFKIKWGGSLRFFSQITSNLRFEGAYDSDKYASGFFLRFKSLNSASSDFTIGFSWTFKLPESPHVVKIDKDFVKTRINYDYKPTDAPGRGSMVFDVDKENTLLGGNYYYKTDTTKVDSGINITNSKFGSKRTNALNYRTTRGNLSLLYVEEQLSDSNFRLNQLTTMKWESGFVFGGGKFGVSEPIRDGFVLLHRHDKLLDTEVIVNEKYRLDEFGNIVVPNLSPYSINRISIESPNLQIGQDLGKQRYKIRPGFNAGYSIKVGTDAVIIIKGYILDPEGKPLNFKVAKIKHTGDPTWTDKTVFTGRGGKMQMGGFKSGTYTLTLVKSDFKTFKFTIPEEAVGLFDLGNVKLVREGSL